MARGVIMNEIMRTTAVLNLVQSAASRSIYVLLVMIFMFGFSSRFDEK